MSKEKKTRKSWSKKRKIKLIVWAVIIIAVALGFVHQNYIHTDGYIQNYIEKNSSALIASAEVLREHPTTSEEFVDSLSTEDRVTSENKYSIDTIMSNPYFTDSKDILQKTADIGIQDVKSDGTSVRFYHSSRFVVIYSPDKEEITGTVAMGDGWFYIKSF